MSTSPRALRASGLPHCWATEFEALRPTDALARAVHHTSESLARMPAGYRWGVAVALRLFPAAFYAVARRRPQDAPPAAVRRAMARLRRAPGFADVLRATTALALYGALDGVARSAPPAAAAKATFGGPR